MTHYTRLLAGVLLTLATTAAAESPSDSQLQSLTGNGDGCTQQSVSGELSPDHQTLSVHYPNFSFTPGLGQGQTRKQSSCYLTVKIRIPMGYTFAVSSVENSASIALDPKAVANVKSEFAWGNTLAGLTPIARQSVNELSHRDFLPATSQPAAAPTWSSCFGTEKTLTIRTTVAVKGPAIAQQRSADLSQKFSLKWRPCGSTSAPVKQVWTRGDVARNSFVCLNSRTGEASTYGRTSLFENQSYARLSYSTLNESKATQNMKRVSYDRMRWTSYQIPGNWQAATRLRPKIEWKALVGGTRPDVKVSQMADDLTCVEVTQAPATVLIKWNPA